MPGCSSTDLVQTLLALRDGRISAAHAQAIARAVGGAGLDRAGQLRGQARGLERAGELSAHQLSRELDRLLTALREADTDARADGQRAERRVTRARDAVLVTGPAETQQAIWQAVSALGERLRADHPDGDGAHGPRTADQARDDALLGALTGDPDIDALPVTVAVTMSSDTLLALTADPGTLTGPGAGAGGELLAPALARRLAARATRASRRTWETRGGARLDAPAAVHVHVHVPDHARDPGGAVSAAYAEALAATQPRHCAWPPKVLREDPGARGCARDRRVASRDPPAGVWGAGDC